MTRKAIFSERQPKVKITTLDKVNYFQICLNEQEVAVSENPTQTTDAVAKTEYQYDFNEWHDSTTNPEDVQNNPEKYLDYTPSEVPTENTPTLVDRIRTLEDQQAATAQAVQDMILMQEG